MGPFLGGLDVFAQVDAVDFSPDRPGRLARFGVGEVRVTVEIGLRVGKNRLPEGHEPFDVPAFDQLGRGIDEDRKVEKVRHEQTRGATAAGLQHVQPFDDHDVGLFDHLETTVDDVVRIVRVDRGRHFLFARLDGQQETHQAPLVVTFGEAFAAHQAALFQHPIGIQEAVGGDEVDLGMARPPGQQRLQDTGSRTFADRHRAGNADHVRHLGLMVAKEGVRCAVELLRGLHVETQQTRQRQVDHGHFVERDVLVDAAQGFKVRFGQSQRGGGAQRAPFFLLEAQKRAGTHLRASSVRALLGARAILTGRAGTGFSASENPRAACRPPAENRAL